MPSSFQFADSRILPASVFDRLAAVMQEFAHSTGDAIVITEADLLSFQLPIQYSFHRFVLAVSPEFSGLLLGELIWQDAKIGPNGSADWGDGIGFQAGRQNHYQTVLEFAPAPIADFVTELQQQFPDDHPLQAQLVKCSPSEPSNPQLQAQFSLHLVAVLSSSSAGNESLPAIASSPSPDSINQSKQGAVFNQVATQIRQTQELSLILQTAIQQVRSFLQAERVVIYQFETTIHPTDPGSSSQPHPLPTAKVVCGRVTYEDRVHSGIPRILHVSEGIQCFIGEPEYQEKFRKGAIQAINDVHAAYPHAPCLINMLDWAHVRAKLVVPIVFQEELWGLLIAHQCSGTRHWQESEIRFLQCVAELVSIAIYQNQLYSQLQLQAQMLEQRVVERTYELYDAVTAAESASISKTEFLATISHELRTPLTAIIGMATTLLRLPTDERREKLLPLAKQQEYLKIIRNSGEHLLELINDIIDLSQVEAGRTVLEIQEFSLSQVAHECLRMLQDKAQRNQIKLKLDLLLAADELDGNNCDRFTADPKRIKQILLNLLSNAIKFTPEGGMVTLRLWTEPETAILQVEDTGIGIPKHQFPLLFKKFQQLERTYQRRYEGTGLGLAITKQLVDLHNGSIQVDSIVNQGSKFTVRIPAQPLKPLLVDSLEDSQEPTATVEGRVVLIEEDESTANLLCDLLTAAGHQVVWMMNGMMALTQSEIIKPELILVGTRLTGISLNEVLFQLRHNATTQTVPVVLLLNSTLVQIDRRLVEEVDACLTMPIQRPEELLNKVRELMTSS
jgi:two-component system sensor histidine kinase/response regulator